MCSINGITGEPNAAKLAIRAASIMQGRGSQSAGVCSWNGQEITTETSLGLVRKLAEKIADKIMSGNQALGHTRYGTAGDNGLQNAQPFSSKAEHLALVHNGEIVGAEEFRQELLREIPGIQFESTSDSEVLLRMLEHSKGEGKIARILSVLEKIKGAYSLVILWDGDLIGACDKLGMHPLCLGAFKNGGHIFASEDTAIRSVGARPVEDVKPGQIIFITPDQNVMTYWIDGHSSNGQRTAHCAFNLVYTAMPTTKVWEANVTEVRRALGSRCFQEMLDQKVLPNIDVVVPMLDSGRTAALEFAKALGHHRIMTLLEKGGTEALRAVDNSYLFPYECGVNRAHDSGRNFQIAAQGDRENEISYKHFGDTAIIKNKRVLIGDDSLVRGTTAKKVVAMLKDLGALEVHFVIFSPPVTRSCFWGGVETKNQELLLAASCSVEEICHQIGADSLHFLSLESFEQVLESFGSGFCLACWGGPQPIKVN